MTMIASRTLTLRDNGSEKKVPVRLFAPEPDVVDWKCRFEVEWPTGKVERHAVGVDPMQALSLALQMIGAQLYASEYHATGRLMWLDPGRGYGFPVPSAMKDVLVGDDARYGA